MRIPTLFAAASLLLTPVAASAELVRINGQATLNDGRIFTVNARLDTDTNTATGKAVLINTNFEGTDGKGPYRAFIDLTCAAELADGTYSLGGYVRRTNDSNLYGAVFFLVNPDDGTISRAVFWDDDPSTVGDAGTCVTPDLTQPGFALEDPIRGGLKVRD